MNKKFFVSLAITLLVIFSFSVCLATTNDLEKAANDVRNFVGGTENTIENAAKDISNTSKDVTGSIGNTNNEQNNNTDTGIISNYNDGYTAERTGTDTSTVMGMTSTAWTWIILGIAAIAIIAVVWYYSMQFTNNNNHIDRE